MSVLVATVLPHVSQASRFVGVCSVAVNSGGQAHYARHKVVS